MGSARWVYPTCVSVGLLALLKVNLSYPTSVLCVQLTRVETDLSCKETDNISLQKNACFWLFPCFFFFLFHFMSMFDLCQG